MIFAADVGMIFLDYRFTIPNFPSRLLSYMDAGLAVLTVTDESTDIGQVVESGKFGISIKSNEAKEFTEAVKVFENADSLNAMKQNSYKYLKEVFDVRIVYDRIMGHFKD